MTTTLKRVTHNFSIAAALAVTTLGANDSASAASRVSHCPANYSVDYLDRVHGFRICLPAGVAKHAAKDYPARSILFTGFSVPAKTNLQAKRLAIVPGDYDLLKNAEGFGRFTANGVTFDRATTEEGSAGHLTLHIIYT